MGWGVVADAHNSALAEATDVAVQEMLLVKQQLAAERDKVKQIQSILDLSDRAKLGNELLQLREKVQTLVDALSSYEYDSNGHIVTWLSEAAHRAALAKVSTYPLPDGQTK